MKQIVQAGSGLRNCNIKRDNASLALHLSRSHAQCTFKILTMQITKYLTVAIMFLLAAAPQGRILDRGPYSPVIDSWHTQRTLKDTEEPPLSTTPFVVARQSTETHLTDPSEVQILLSSGRQVAGFVNYRCSNSTRGYSQADIDHIQAQIKFFNRYSGDVHSTDEAKEDFRVRHATAATEAWN